MRKSSSSLEFTVSGKCWLFVEMVTNITANRLQPLQPKIRAVRVLGNTGLLCMLFADFVLNGSEASKQVF
jgi:hypothetical protein